MGQAEDPVQPVIDRTIADSDRTIADSDSSGSNNYDDYSVVLVRDEAGLFDATLHSEVRLQLLGLKRETAVSLFLVTRIVPSLDDVEVIAYDLFRSLVRAEGHYKIILILVAIDPKTGQGTVSTNLGAGVYHLLDRKDCEGLFVREGEQFSPEGVRQGISFLKTKIENAFARGRRADVAAGNKMNPHELSFLAQWGWVLILAGSMMLVLVVIYASGRKPKCPRCGEELKTKVNVVFGTGGSDLARKTFKCFKCGYVKRRSIIPSALIGNRDKDR